MRLWYQHMLALRQALRHLGRHPWRSLCILVALTSSTLLPWLSAHWLWSLHHEPISALQGQVSLVLQAQQDPKPILQKLNQDPRVQHKRVETGTEAWRTLQQAYQLDTSEPAPELPTRIRVALAPTVEAQKFAQTWQQHATLQAVEIDTPWQGRLLQGVRLLRQILFLSTATLAALLLAIIIQAHAQYQLEHQAEIEVSLLMGAHPAYVRRPWLYHVVLLTGSASGFACVSAALMQHWLSPSVRDLLGWTPALWPDASLWPLLVLPTVLACACARWGRLSVGTA